MSIHTTPLTQRPAWQMREEGHQKKRLRTVNIANLVILMAVVAALLITPSVAFAQLNVTNLQLAKSKSTKPPKPKSTKPPKSKSTKPPKLNTIRAIADFVSITKNGNGKTLKNPDTNSRDLKVQDTLSIRVSGKREIGKYKGNRKVDVNGKTLDLRI